MREMPEHAEEVGAVGTPPGWAFVEVHGHNRYAPICGALCAAQYDIDEHGAVKP